MSEPLPITHPGEESSNLERARIACSEPKSLRTFTPTQAVIARGAGVFLWTAEGRRLYDFTSGVLVANLGHNPSAWTERFFRYMGWPGETSGNSSDSPPGYFSGPPLNAYNAITPIEALASSRLLETVRGRPGGSRCERVLWAASGSEAIHKALAAALALDQARSMILATRNGFHGKKGLAHAVTGNEDDHDRDPRVRFISFPSQECRDLTQRDGPFDPSLYMRELESLLHQFGRRIGILITEPYLGAPGSFHPPLPYLQLLQRFCRDNDIVFILDEVQANFGRTGRLFAFETYGIEPDMVVLGKGLGNGVPVSAVVGREDILSSLDYGEGSDTWSANPLSSAAVAATLDEFQSGEVLESARRSSAIIEAGLLKLKSFPFVAHIRGEKGGMVWGVEMRDWQNKTAAEWANAAILACYLGDGAEGIHILGALAKKVLRIAPPLVIQEAEAHDAIALMHRLFAKLSPDNTRLFPS